VHCLSDIAHFLPRCPRCGYGLRMVRGYWWCDVCRAHLPPQKGPSFREGIRRVGERLRRFFSPPPRRPPVLVYPGSASTTLGQGVSLARCPKCGALTPRNAASCARCGTVFGQRAETPVPRATPGPRISERDEIVYRYVVERNGEISLSKASTDLRMTTLELQASIRRLEDSGKISREGSGGG
jgi:predicted amidophosphoribosyltransferase